MKSFTEIKVKSENLVLAFNNVKNKPISLDSFFEESSSDDIKEEMRTHFHSFDVRKSLFVDDIMFFNEQCGFTKEFKDIICK